MSDDKRGRLRRMQRLTTGLLAGSLLLLIASVRLQSHWPWLRWMQAFAEASAIGAIADWYAVVALFRRPLGLPIPHTAIIPTKQSTIGASLGEFVAQYLLTPETIVGKLSRFDTARQLAQWFAQPANASAVADSFTSFVPALLRAPDDADLRRLFRSTLVPGLLELDAARIAGRLTERLMDAGLHRAAFDRGLALLDGWLVDSEELIRERFAEASRYTPAFVDGYIVRKFVGGVRALIHEVVIDPLHPLRQPFDAALRSWARELTESPQQRARARDWLQGAIEAISGDEDLRRLRDALAAHTEADLAREDSALRRYVSSLIVTLASGILGDAVILARLNGLWLRLVRTASARHGGQIASLIAEVVRGWDAEEVSRKIELEIGADLQFIRINGALVGGIVGLVLYACTVLLGRGS